MAKNSSGASSPLKVSIASVFGNALEFFDFTIYGTLTALVFNKLFFPSFDPTVGVLLAFVTFAVGFISRPLGGAVFGHFGDKIGRKSMLILTLTIMGLSTFAIGLLPTYSSIGIWAPILLVFFRFCQGLGTGGEWGGAILMATEHAPKNKRGFYSSIVQMGSPIGIILSSGLITILLAALSKEQFLTWGWRVPLLSSIILVVIGLFIRLKVMESPSFQEIKKENKQTKLPFLTLIKKHPRNILVGTGIHVGDAAFGFLIGVFIISYATNQLGLSNTFATLTNTLANLAYLILVPISGALSDRFGRKPVYMGSTIMLILFSFPFFGMISIGNPTIYFIAAAMGAGILGLMYGTQAILYSEMFSTEVRYSGVSIGFQISTVLGGGFMPSIANRLQDLANGKPWLIAIYISLLGIIQLIAVIAAKKVKQD